GAGAAAELGIDVVEIDPARREQDCEVIEQVGRLRPHAGAVLGNRRDDQLDGLLAELLGTLRGPAGEQLRRVGRVRTVAAPCSDDGGEILQAQALDAHPASSTSEGSRRTGMPATAIRSLAARIVCSPK